MAAGRVNVSRKPESHQTSRKASEFCDGGAGVAKRDMDIVFDDSTNAWGGEVMDVDFQSVPPSPKRRKLSQDVSDKNCCGFVPVSNESPLGSISSLTYQTCGSGEREPGQLDEEDFSNAPNIMTSRWASDDDLLEEIPTRSGEKKAKSSENQSGSHGSDEGCIQRHSSIDEYSSDELQNENGLMEIGEASDGRPLIHDDFESSDDEESMAPMCGHSSRNMVQASRSVFDYERLGKISEGSYGIVFKARDKETGEVVALKKLKMAKEREGFPLHYLREINLMLSFNHPSIVNVKEVVVDESDEGFGNVFMVMEHMEHDLKGLMQSRKEAYSPSEVKCLMVQLLQGVKYLHDNWVLHRDLKTSNLLVNNKGELKICDFGMSRQYGSPLKPYTSLVVTLWYRAPELLLGAKEYSTAVDMWSVGCIMAELLSNKPLFNGETEVQQLNKIFGTLGTPNDKIWPGYSQLPGAKASFANHRYNRLREIFPCPLFTGSPILSDLGLDLLNKLLTYNPEERITAEDALKHPWFSEIPLPMSKEFMPTFPVQRSCRR